MNNFDLRKYLAEGRLIKEEINYQIELLVPEVAFDVESGEMSDSPYEFATEDEIESGEADVTTYTDGDELDEYVFGRSYEQALHFAKEYPNLIKINTGKLKEENQDHSDEEDLKLDRDYDKGGKYYSEDGAEAFRIQPFKMNDIEYTKHEANRMGRYIVGLDGQALKQFISDYMGAFEADKGETELGRTFK